MTAAIINKRRLENAALVADKLYSQRGLIKATISEAATIADPVRHTQAIPGATETLQAFDYKGNWWSR